MSNDEPEIKRKEEARRRCRSLSSPPRRKHPTRTKTGDSQTSDTAFTTKYKCLISFNSIFSFSTFQTGRKCNNPVKSQTQNISQCFCFYLSIILIFFSEIVDGFVTKIGDWSFPILNLKFWQTANFFCSISFEFIQPQLRNNLAPFQRCKMQFHWYFDLWIFCCFPAFKRQKMSKTGNEDFAKIIRTSLPNSEMQSLSNRENSVIIFYPQDDWHHSFVVTNQCYFQTVFRHSMQSDTHKLIRQCLFS